MYCTLDTEKTERVLWSSKNIPFSGSPFIIEKVVDLQCVNGPNYFKPKTRNFVEVSKFTIIINA